MNSGAETQMMRLRSFGNSVIIMYFVHQRALTNIFEFVKYPAQDTSRSQLLKKKKQKKKNNI